MKPAPLVALGLALNRGKSADFVLISGRYTSRGRPDHLTTWEHSDRGCGEADSVRGLVLHHHPHGPRPHFRGKPRRSRHAPRWLSLSWWWACESRRGRSG